VRIARKVPSRGESCRNARPSGLLLDFEPGSDDALYISESRWSELKQRVGSHSIKDASTYYPFAGGLLDCKTAIVESLNIGGCSIADAAVFVYPEASKHELEAWGTLGMQCFLGTRMVLDFERKRMWIRKTEEVSAWLEPSCAHCAEDCARPDSCWSEKTPSKGA
jgi:hypothetical protein